MAKSSEPGRVVTLIHRILGLLPALLLTACGGVVDLPNDTLPSDMPVAKQVPKHAGKSARVIMLEFKNNERNSRKAELDKVAYASVRQSIQQIGAKLMDDRQVERSLSKEIEAYEIQGLSEYQGPDLASHAVSGEVNQVTLSKHFIKSEKYQGEDGKIKYTPSKCQFTARAAGAVTVFTVNPLAKDITLTFNGSSSYTVESRNRYCPIARQDSDSLMQAAVSNGIRRIASGIQNRFSPVGYVMKKRVDHKQKNAYFRISLKPEMGATPGTEARILREDKDIDPVTGRVLTEKTVLARGMIVRTTQPDQAWVKIKHDQAGAVKAGHLVMLKFGGGWRSY